MANGNLKLAKSIISLIENFDNVKHDNYIQFSKSYKMAVSFKVNNDDFSLLSCWSLPYATTCNSLSDKVSLSSKHLPNSTNELLPLVSCFYVVRLLLTKRTLRLNHLRLIVF